MATVLFVLPITVAPGPDLGVGAIVLSLDQEGSMHHVLYPGPLYHLPVLVYYLSYPLSHVMKPVPLVVGTIVPGVLALSCPHVSLPGAHILPPVEPLVDT